MPGADSQMIYCLKFLLILNDIFDDWIGICVQLAIGKLGRPGGQMGVRCEAYEFEEQTNQSIMTGAFKHYHSRALGSGQQILSD